MKKFTIALLMILSINFCLGTIVYLRKGGTIEGEVISKDDEKFVIKTAKGEETIKWRLVKNKSIKEIYPELYEALKAQALERKKKKEKTIKAKKNIEKKSDDLSKINLKIKTTEKLGNYKKMDHNHSIRKYQKKSYGIISILLSKLNPKKSYTVKTVYSHYLKPVNKSDMPLEKSTGENNIVKEEEISGRSNYEIEYQSLPYYIFKVKAKTGYYVKKVRGKYLTKIEFGYKTAGWDISIWLNGTLAYEKKKGETATYHNNISH
ncbi:MAG: hypothetical protein DRI44_05890 [Chlamydiae bacterium]|nr:MAG: hypothetical protein DRI44_05890 [Chlamydiota bacterium]